MWQSATIRFFSVFTCTMDQLFPQVIAHWADIYRLIFHATVCCPSRNIPKCVSWGQVLGFKIKKKKKTGQYCAGKSSDVPLTDPSRGPEEESACPRCITGAEFQPFHLWLVLEEAGRPGRHSNMASSWSARSSNMLPMSSRIFPAAFTELLLLQLGNRQQAVRKIYL